MVRRVCGIVLLGLTLSGCSKPAWTPPPNPSPKVILRQASADARAGDYAVALAKHVWYHDNAVRLEPAQSGVRLSFALADWDKLAEKYPPARDALRDARNAAEQTLLAGGGYDAFADFVALNELLHDESRTAAFFKTLDQDDPRRARRLFRRAQPALVRAKEYALCGKYIGGPSDYQRLVEGLNRNLALAAKPNHGARLAQYAHDSFRHRSALLVALLTVNDRRGEAEEIAADALQQLPGEPRFADELDEALEGVVPPSWP